MAKYIEGAAELRAALRELAKSVAVPLNQVGRDALKPMLDEMRNRVPVDEGDLKRSLAIRREPRESTRLRPVFRVGPRSDYVGQDGNRPARTSHLVEFGKIGGRRQPYAIPAFEFTKQTVVDRIGKNLWLFIEKRARQLANKKPRKK